METRTDILNELGELSPLIAGMEKTNVFAVPQGYFEGLADRMLEICNVEEQGILSGLPKPENAEVPAGYFDNLADTIMARIKAEENKTALDELRKLSPALYSIQNQNIFEVPTGYFEGLADSVMAKINVGVNETAAEELRMLSPILYSIQNENVFEVPKGYFADLSNEIMAKVKPAKVVTMRKRSNNFMKYAVAAAFTGVMALAVFKFTSNSNNDKTDPIVAQGRKIAEENKIDEEMAKVTDADIVKYLEASGSDAKTALVANVVDENTLPSQDDYLIDEHTLDKYLNSINVNDLKN